MKMKLNVDTSKKTKRTDTQNFYLTNDAIYSEWKAWKLTGCITENLAIYIRDIATRLTFAPSFRGYSEDIKEDMVSSALLKCFRNLKNLKEEKRDSFFQYLTRCCYCAFYGVLAKHYKHVNLRKRLTEMALDRLAQENGQSYAIEQLRKDLDVPEACQDDSRRV